jgi:arylsulfatase A-like enzyme
MATRKTVRARVSILVCAAAAVLSPAPASGAAPAAAAPAATAPPAARRPNVLFIAVDDLRPALGCYGNAVVKSPHIDALARSGVRFERAYCQFPLCNPSRASLLTGRYPAATRITDNTDHFRAHLPDAVTLPEHFRAHGYVTLRAGKILHGGLDDERSWVEGGEAPRPRAPTPAERAKSRQAEAERQGYVLDRPWKAVDGEGEGLPDHKTASRAIELLEKHGDKPFFLAVGFVKPHTPFIAPKKYFALYDPKAIKLPVDFAPRPTVGAGVPAVALNAKNSDLFTGGEGDTRPEHAREAIAAYYASVSFVDAQVGRVLAALDRLKLRDRTIVAFFGDHGFHLGEKGKWSKHGSLYEAGTRVPFIVAAPRAAGNGKTSGRTVELVDLYPTLVGLAGLPPVRGVHGQSLAPLLANPQAPWEHAAYSVAGAFKGRSVRTERHRYTEWGADGELGAELYDHATDPHELKNLASDPRHKATVDGLRKLLRQSPAAARPGT